MTVKLTVFDKTGKKISEVDGSALICKINEHLVAMACRAQLAGMRHAIAHTKTRAEVRGGGKKPWRQKGTGRARVGSSRNPVWTGGGVAHGPRNDRNFEIKLNRTSKLAALRSAISLRAGNNSFYILDKWDDKISTKTYAKFKQSVSPTARLLVIHENNKELSYSVRNEKFSKALSIDYLNPLDIMNNTKIVITKNAFETLTKKFQNDK